MDAIVEPISTKPTEQKSNKLKSTEKKSKPQIVSKNVFKDMHETSATSEVNAVDELWRDKLIATLDHFLNNASETILEFPADLQSYERRLVHQVKISLGTHKWHSKVFNCFIKFI